MRAPQRKRGKATSAASAPMPRNQTTLTRFDSDAATLDRLDPVPEPARHALNTMGQTSIG